MNAAPPSQSQVCLVMKCDITIEALFVNEDNSSVSAGYRSYNETCCCHGGICCQRGEDNSSVSVAPIIMTFAVDWALKTNYLSIYFLSLPQDDQEEWEEKVSHSDLDVGFGET